MSTPVNPGTSAKRLGKFMIIAAWILLLMLLTWFFNHQIERQRNPNPQLLTSLTAEGLPAVQLQRNRFGQYVATGHINGEPVEFLLDTGASDVSVPLPVAERLGLRKGRAVLYQTANGNIKAWQTVIDEIRLGDIRVGPVRASINPGFQGSGVLLGMSFLRHLDFSQQGNTLTLQYPPPE